MENILQNPKFQETLTEIAREQGVSGVQVAAEASEYLKELAD